ncbi:MAG: acyl-CoA dehydrogenase family protein [Desulfobacterales bacterium]|nr:acyl-CoA dehydrogenase family protein [Desulfobacterales bacterium]
MNFDFNQSEQTFLKELDTLLKGINCKNIDVNELLKELAKTDYLKIEISPFLMAAMEILSSYTQSLFLSIEVSTRIFGRIISNFGNDNQKQTILPGLFDGKLIGAVALSEDSMNIDNEPLKTKGYREDDFIIVNGNKSYVVNAGIADYFAVAGRIDDKDAIFLIEKGTNGLSVSDRLHTIGYDGTSISNLYLKDCKINETNVLYPKLSAIRMWENQVLIGATLGMMKASFESAKNYAKTHKTGGKPIIAYQEIGFKLAEMLTTLQTSQLFAYRSCWLYGIGDKEADIVTYSAKVFCGESAEKVASDALQILSGAGVLCGNPAEEAYRCSKYAQIAGTSTEISRVKIGDAALGRL